MLPLFLSGNPDIPMSLSNGRIVSRFPFYPMTIRRQNPFSEQKAEEILINFLKQDFMHPTMRILTDIMSVKLPMY